MLTWKTRAKLSALSVGPMLFFFPRQAVRQRERKTRHAISTTQIGLKQLPNN